MVWLEVRGEIGPTTQPLLCAKLRWAVHDLRWLQDWCLQLFLRFHLEFRNCSTLNRFVVCDFLWAKTWHVFWFSNSFVFEHVRTVGPLTSQTLPFGKMLHIWNICHVPCKESEFHILQIAVVRERWKQCVRGPCEKILRSADHGSTNDKFLNWELTTEVFNFWFQTTRTLSVLYKQYMPNQGTKILLWNEFEDGVTWELTVICILFDCFTVSNVPA